MSIAEAEKEIENDFELFDEWSDKYQYIIELGQKLPPLAKEFYSDTYKVKGCQSSLWLNASIKDGIVKFEADSESTFVKGLTSLIFRVLNNRTPKEILDAEMGFIKEIGLQQHLAQTRANGLASMIKQMKLYALAFS